MTEKSAQSSDKYVQISGEATSLELAALQARSGASSGRNQAVAKGCVSARNKGLDLLGLD